MLTDTEIAFLRARLGEDEAAAKAAAEASAAAWRAEPNVGEDWWAVMYTGPSTIRPYDEFDYPVAERVDRADAAHIARHDPARILREVAVWRSLLLDYQTAPLDAVYGGTERETGFRLMASAALKAKIATYDGNPVTGESFPSGQARG
jgi:hypothetical protein